VEQVQTCVTYIVPDGYALLMSKLQIVSEFWVFLRERKKYWLAPIMVVLLLMSLLIVLTQGSPLAPFIYSLF